MDKELTIDINKKKGDKETERIVYQLTNDMLDRHNKLIDETFLFIVKEKPFWMPKFIYKAVIKNCVEFIIKK